MVPGSFRRGLAAMSVDGGPGVLFAASLVAADWPEIRGPGRDGRCAETALAESWSPDGKNLLFKAPYGGRLTPVILGDRLF